MSETNKTPDPVQKGPSTLAFFLWMPVALGIWFVPLFYADTIGIMKSLAIIFFIIFVIVIMAAIPRPHRRKAGHVLYTR